MNANPIPTSRVVKNEAEMADFAAEMAAQISPPCTVALLGDLGAGKTAFARAFIRSMEGVDAGQEVPSPTFTLLQSYDAAKGPVHHFDLYRLEAPEEVLELGWDEALDEGICLIEWPDKAGRFLPATRIDIEITHVPDATQTHRRLTIQSRGEAA